MGDNPTIVFSPEEAGHRLGLSPATVKRFGRLGRLPRVRVSGSYYFTRDGIEAELRAAGGRRKPVPRKDRSDRGIPRGRRADVYRLTHLRAVRQWKGKSVKGLAEASGVGHPTIIRAETHGRPVYRVTAEALAAALGVPLSAIGEYAGPVAP